MNDIKTNCIESRRNALLGAYNITDQELLGKINGFFNDLEKFAENCSDVADFEAKFQASSLQQDYSNLFVEAMNKSEGVDPEKEKDSIANDIASEAIDDAKMYGRRKVHQEVYDQARDIPVVGDALNVKQHFDFFSRFKRNKDK